MRKVVICNETILKDGKLSKRYNTAKTYEDSEIVKEGVKNANGGKP